MDTLQRVAPGQYFNQALESVLGYLVSVVRLRFLLGRRLVFLAFGSFAALLVLLWSLGIVLCGARTCSLHESRFLFNRKAEMHALQAQVPELPILIGENRDVPNEVLIQFLLLSANFVGAEIAVL